MIGFVPGISYQERLDVTSPNWLPSLNLRPSAAAAAAATGRWERRKAREIQISQREAAQHPSLQTDVSETETICSDDGSVAGFVEDVSTQTATVSTQTATNSTDASAQTVSDIRTQTEKWERVTPPPFSLGTFTNDELVKFYTGLPNLKVLKAVYNHIMPGLPASKNKLEPFQEFILC